MKFIVYLLLAINLSVFSGCAGTISTSTATQQSQAQSVATKSVLAMGEVLATAPGVIKSLRESGRITKADYNNAVDIYNQALASYTLLNQALQSAIIAGQDPSSTASYVTALAKFTNDKNLLTNIIAASGGKL